MIAIRALFYSGICQHICVGNCDSEEFPSVELDGLKSGNSWVTCQHSRIGKAEDTYKGVHDNRSIQGFPGGSPQCSVIISSIENEEQVENPFSIFVGTALRKLTIALKCTYALPVIGARYRWWRLGKGGDASAPIANQAILRYVLDKKVEKYWHSFFSSGLEFLCQVSTPISIKNKTVTVKGIQHINYGDSQIFECGSNSHLNASKYFTWKIDGKVESGRESSIELLTFKYNQPKRVFVECEDKQGNNLARYTMLVCAIEDVQQIFKLISMYIIPIAFVFLAATSIFLPIIQDKAKLLKTYVAESKHDKYVNTVLNANSKLSKDSGASVGNIAISFLAFTPLLMPLCSIFFYVMDVITDYLAIIGYIFSGDYKWALGTLTLTILCAIATSATTLNSLNFGSQHESKTILNHMTKTKFRRYFAYISICMFSPITFQLELFLTNFEIWNLHVDKKKTVCAYKKSSGNL